MDVFSALTTAISGLRAQSHALDNISGNIANSTTAGFKRLDTSFVDLVVDRPRQQTVSGSVSSFSRQTNTLQGDILPTGVESNMALNGGGFFAVAQRAGYQDGRAVFETTDLFTRRGDFAPDRDGYLVNGAGYALKGSSLNPATGETTSLNGPIRISDAPVPARATGTISYRGILPSRPATTAADPAVAGSELLVPPAPAANPFGTDPVTAVTADQNSAFLNRSISGGLISVYNELGNPVDVHVRWAKTGNTAGAESWQMFYQSDSAATGAQTMWQNLGGVTFDAAGARTGAPADGRLAFPADAQIGGVPVGGLAVDFGTNGLSQFSVPSGVVQALSLEQDGYPAGTLEGIAVSADGRIAGLYTNGRSLPLAQVAVMTFNAPNALKYRDGGAFEQTLESGNPVAGNSGTLLVGGSVEQSNVDIADEFSKMIVTQQAYSANTRVVTTAQQMIQDSINMIR